MVRYGSKVFYDANDIEDMILKYGDKLIKATKDKEVRAKVQNPFSYCDSDVTEKLTRLGIQLGLLPQ